MVTIRTYSPGWPEAFAAIARELRDGLGDLALRIDHIGSTSVEGLDAKDTIDVQIAVAALDPEVGKAMTALGYSSPATPYRDHVPPGFADDENWDKLFFFAPEGRRPQNTHVRVLGRANWRFALLFRDYLRAHRTTVEAYAELKRRLAASLAVPESYSGVKDPAVDLIYFAAEAWAERIGWQPGPADA